MGDDRRIITLLTDFGTEDGYVCAMKGVILNEAPEAEIVDAAHSVAPQDIRAGAWALGQYWPYYPPGTIHVAVVDPGVGTERQALIVEADGHFFIAPDNGILWWVEQQASDFQPRRVKAGWHRPGDLSPTFHGRDIFAYAAGLLAAGRGDIEAMTEKVDDIVRPKWAVVEEEEDCLWGEIIHTDHFGNLITNISKRRMSELGWKEVSVEAADKDFGPIRQTYGDVEPGKLVALFDSAALLELAVRDGSAAAQTDLCRRDKVVVRRMS